jgi:acetyl esterase/lipase
VEWITRYYDSKIVLKRAIDIAFPKGNLKSTALFFIHGGGYSQGLREHFHYHLEHFSNSGFLCASAGYRLVPAVTLREQLADLYTGYKVFVEYIREKKLEINNVIIIGSSAGAHLGSLISLQLSDPDYIKPSACVSINGPGTLEKWPNMDEEIKNLIEEAMRASYDRDNDAERFKEISLMKYVNEQSPDFLFIIVGKERFFPHEFVYSLSDKLKQFHKRAKVVLFPEAKHGFFYELKTDEQKQALDVLEKFVDQYK